MAAQTSNGAMKVLSARPTAMAALALLAAVAVALALIHALPALAQEPGADPLAGFTLVDASDQTELATLTDGASVELADPNGGSYGIRADLADGESVGSVSLELSGAKSVGPRTENLAPYSLYGDGGADALDGEPLPAGSYTLTATAYAESRLGGDELGTLEVSFTVSRANRAPTFGSATYSFSVAEDAATGTAVGSVSATDADDDGLTYSIETGNGDGKFAMDGSSGAITTAGALDYETDSSYTLTVQADDGNGGTATATVNVTVTDVEETSPGPLTGFTLVDASDQTMLAALTDGASVELADPDGGSYGIRADVDANATIGSVRLALSGAKTVSRTENVAPYSLYGDGGADDLNGDTLPAGSYTLTATAYANSNLGGDELGTLEMSFTVTQANRSPQFGSATYNFSVAEDAAAGTAVGTVSASDADSDGLTYTIESGNGDGKFAIDGSSGAVTTAGALNHATTPSYALTVQADDGNGGTDTATVTVTVTDVAESVPPDPPTGLQATATSASVTLTWTAPAQTLAGYLVYRKVRDADPPEDFIPWGFPDGDATTYVDTVVDPETAYAYHLVAVKSALELSEPSATVDVDTLAPDPDGTRQGAVSLGAQSPSMGRQFFYNKSLDRAVGDPVDYYSFTTDGRYELGLGVRDQTIDLDSWLEDADGNAIIQSRPPADPGRDQTVEWLQTTIEAGTYYIKVAAMEDGQTGYYLRFQLNAPPANSAPAFGHSAYDFSVAEDVGVGAILGRVLASDADSGDTLTYSITAGNGDGRFAIAGAGDITVAAALDYETETAYTLTMQADDGNGATATTTVNVTVANVVDPFDGFTLLDASDQSVLATLTEGATVGLDDPDEGSYALRAHVSAGSEGAAVGSVSLELSGTKTVSRTLDQAPYSLYGDDAAGALSGEALPAGSYTLTATAYSETDLGGDELASLSVSFTVAKQEPPVPPSPPALAARHDRVLVSWLLPTQPATVTVEAMELLRDGLVVASPGWQRDVTNYQYVDTDVMPEATYAYQLRMTAVGETLLGTVVEATTSSPPANEPVHPLLLAMDDRDADPSGATPLNAPVVGGEAHQMATAQAQAIIAAQGGGNAEWAQANGLTWALATTTQTGNLATTSGDMEDNYSVTLEDAYDQHTLGIKVTGLGASITVKVTDSDGAVVGQGANGAADNVTLDTLTLPYGTYNIELRLAENKATSYTLSYELDALDPWADLRGEAEVFDWYRVDGTWGRRGFFWQLGWPPEGWDRAFTVRKFGYFLGSDRDGYTPSDPVIYHTFDLDAERAVMVYGSGGPADKWHRDVYITLEDSDGRTVARGRRPELNRQVLTETIGSGTYYSRVEWTQYDDRCRDLDFFLANKGVGGICRSVNMRSALWTWPPPDDPDKSPDIKVSYDVPNHAAPKLITPPDDPQADNRFTPIQSRHTIDYARLTWELPRLGGGVTISSYTLQRNDEGDGGAWVDLHSSDTPFTAYTDRTVQPYAYYYYRLKLQTSDGEVRSPAYVSANPRFTHVGEVYIKEIAKDSVTIAWHPVQDIAAIDGYRIYDRAGTIENHTLVATVGPGVTEYTHENLPYSPWFYSYKVVPFKSDQRGQGSFEATAFVVDHPDLREKRDGYYRDAAMAPWTAGMVYDKTPRGDVWVRWGLSPGNAVPTGYQIRRTTSRGGKVVNVEIIDVPGKHSGDYVDREFPWGMQYYEVRAVNEYGYGGWGFATCWPEDGLMYFNYNGSQYRPDSE